MNEQEIYTKIGEYMLSIIPEDDWDYAILYTVSTHGVIEGKGSYFKGKEKKSLDFFLTQYNIKEAIDNLRKFTDLNNYTPWNKLEFTLTADHKFDVKFIWDQEEQDRHDNYAKGIFD